MEEYITNDCEELYNGQANCSDCSRFANDCDGCEEGLEKVEW